MTTTIELTTRQQQVLTRLEAGMAVTDIALDLGVTRNAVYLQIAALKRKGALAHDFTASGRPPRGSARTGDESPVLVALLDEVDACARELERVAIRLRTLTR